MVKNTLLGFLMTLSLNAFSQTCTITLTSAPGTNTQTKCINTAIANITYNTTIATGATVTGLPPGVTGNWVSNVLTISGTPSNSAPFSYTVNLTGGCGSVNATGTITVTAAPNAGTLSGSTAICSNLTTTLSSTVTGGSWTSGTTAVATIVSGTGIVAGVSAGSSIMTYTVAGTGGCSNATATTTVTVTEAPSAGTLSGLTAICSNLTTTLSSTVSGGSWTSATTGVASIVVGTGVVSGVASGTSIMTYTVTGTGGCLNATATRTVTVNTTPVIQNQTLDICSESSFSLVPVNNVGGNIIPSGTHYSWSVPLVSNISGLNSGANSDSISSNLTSLTYENQTVIYYVTPSSVNCSGIPFNVIVNVLRKPNLISSPDQTICAGQPIQIFSADQFGNQNLFFNWSNSPDAATLNFPFIFNPTAHPAQDAVYVVEVIDPSTSCLAYDTVRVTINSLASLQINSSAASICLGGSVELNSGNIAADWFSNGNLISQNQNQITVSPIETTNYEVIYTSANCVVSDNLTINVNAIPTPTISGSNIACQNSHWQAYTVNSTDQHAFYWSVENGEVMSGQGTNIALLHWFEGSQGSISVNENNWLSGCNADAQFNVSLDGLAPDITTIVQLSPGSNVLVCENSTFTIYNWGYESKAYPGAIYVDIHTQYCSFSLFDPASYYYFVDHGTDPECLTRSYFIAPPVITSIESATLKSIKIFPNPASDNLYLEFSKDVNKLISLKIIAVDGKIFLSENNVNLQMPIHISEIPSGIYILEIRTLGEIYRKPFVKQ